MNKENEEPKLMKQYFQTIQSDLDISGGTLGLYLNMHSELRTPIVEYPENLVINKNNTAPCGANTMHTYRIKNGRRPHFHPEEIALRLTDGLDVCYTMQQYTDDVFKNKNFKYNEESGQLIQTRKSDGSTHRYDAAELFEGACSTLTGINETFSKFYQPTLQPGDHPVRDAPEFTVAFGGIPFNMITEGLEDFLTKFRIRSETVSPLHLEKLTSLFEKIKEGGIYTIDINTLLYFFRDVFHARQVNIFDVGCSPMYNFKLGRFYTKPETTRIYALNHRENPRLGYGGKSKKNIKKRTKKQSKKLKLLNRPH